MAVATGSPSKAAAACLGLGFCYGPILLQKSGLDGPPRRDFEVGSRPLVAARSDEGGDAPVPTLTTPHEHAAPNATFT